MNATETTYTVLPAGRFSREPDALSGLTNVLVTDVGHGTSAGFRSPAWITAPEQRWLLRRLLEHRAKGNRIALQIGTIAVDGQDSAEAVLDDAVSIAWADFVMFDAANARRDVMDRVADLFPGTAIIEANGDTGDLGAWRGVGAHYDRWIKAEQPDTAGKRLLRMSDVLAQGRIVVVKHHESRGVVRVISPVEGD